MINEEYFEIFDTIKDAVVQVKHTAVINYN
jgi:hypothetical protein